MTSDTGTGTAAFVFVDDEEEADPFPLSGLSGATLSYETADGETEVVHFDE